MPYFLGAISFALFIGCIIHAIRNDRVFPWIFILFFFAGHRLSSLSISGDRSEACECASKRRTEARRDEDRRPQS